MYKIAQFGEGNFLRTFVDVYFDTINKSIGEERFKVTIIKPIENGNIEVFMQQNNNYNVVLRGMTGGKVTEEVYKIDVVEKVFSPFEDEPSFFEIAKDPCLKMVVSNTTEAGIFFDENDKSKNFPRVTFPAKLTMFLYARFCANLDGVYILPVELIENNASKLKNCVDNYIDLWKLPDEFRKWNDNQNYYCNTLVDRIVSGYPKDEKTKQHITDLIGHEDKLVSIGEPFGLWVIEKKGNISDYISEGKHNIDVVLTPDISYYKKRKVRILNGSHTNLVAAGLWLGKKTVYDCMTDKYFLSFINETLNNEIIPYVSYDIEKTRKFAESVKERFCNPYLNHSLTSIALNSISKWKARVLPSFRDYFNKECRLPKNLVTGFSYMLLIYSSVSEIDGKWIVKLPENEIEILDNITYLKYFSQGGKISDFMADSDVWGEDLTLYDGFYETVIKNIQLINSGINLLEEESESLSCDK